MKIIDAHSHIDYITHDVQTGVVGTICCATNESQWKNLIDLWTKDKTIYSAFGIHPWFINTIQNGFEKRLYELLKLNEKFMVGEIGVDKYKPDMESQIDIFVKQLNVAVELNRTVFLHCVGAWDKILHILKQYKKTPTIVAHDFNGGPEILNTLIKNYDFMFSIHRADKPTEIQRIEEIPVDKILVESDAKSDVVLSDVVDKISIIKEQENISDIIYENTQRIISK